MSFHSSFSPTRFSFFAEGVRINDNQSFELNLTNPQNYLSFKFRKTQSQIICHLNFAKRKKMNESPILISATESSAKESTHLCSVPEPPPKDEGLIVPGQLLKWIITHPQIHEGIKTDAVDLILARDSYGFKKYGQHLRSHDGRNDLEDLMQEIGDAMQYAMKAKINGCNLTAAREMVQVLLLLISE